MNLLILADDLSGAADCAIGFARAGRRTVVALDASRARAEAGVEVMAVDTDSRRLAPEEAARLIRAAWRAWRAPGRKLYKKIDSTLRGNWVAEVAALQPYAGLAMVAPAFPDAGRITRGARVYVHGVPLEATETWQLEALRGPADVRAMLEAAGLRTESAAVALLRGDADALTEHVRGALRRGVQALVVDAEHCDDLAVLARATTSLVEPFFWVGSAGLARELAALASTVDRNARDAPSCDPLPRATADRCGAILAMVGSLSAVSERQCAILRERGALAELSVPPDVLRSRERHPEWVAWQDRVASKLCAGEDLVLRIGRDEAFDVSEGPRLSDALAAMAAPHFAHIAGLIATGGETARAMLNAVQVDTLELIDEIEAGVPLARAANAHRPQVVTKAGAFGSHDALYAAYRQLCRGRPTAQNQRMTTDIDRGQKT
jgi:uncharacterized protein YgbK (DUF1537 family)